ncbi:MAG: FliA/WhiG family RNA polymerase sigma factor [Acidobacteriaceae bacterium]|nr:FliA/WhiG family RNA polymerase sigma factor [Acidobacteriaceae bacterium]MBV9296351.1 FliA/WhiG family RNA polymerase sigma factor [Acidobacteriaceae bacterium]MBV9766580.1 FliA/WhiG family RNA polymerase sigma factor [Acidobacteriaceae bacterium]
MNAAASKRAIAKTPAPESSSRRDELILEHLPLATAIAAHIQKSVPVHIELNDLIHAGVMGLFDAATKYRDDKKVAFACYAKHRIRGAILDSLRQLDWASRDLRKRYKQVELVTRDLEAKLERTPIESEIASAMGLNTQRWQALMVDFRSLGAAAMQARASDRDESYQQETPCEVSQCPDQVFARSELREKLNSALNTLPERYQQVVRLYYERDMTMKEIGSVLGVNESRVSQIHKSALERMQNALGGNGIHSTAAFC